jgi:hypothetical protein
LKWLLNVRIVRKFGEFGPKSREVGVQSWYIFLEQCLMLVSLKCALKHVNYGRLEYASLVGHEPEL